MPSSRYASAKPVSSADSADAIIVRGARVHNLKNVDVDIPHNRLVVLTGVSGSGKSSLAFDTLFAEGQRRYLESLSAYTRQFLDQLERPDVDSISGLPPAISIDQKTGTARHRSTLATTTQIYDYLRLLYARAGQAHCPQCGIAVSRQTSQQIVDRILQLEERRKVMILAPLVRGRKGQHRQVFEKICREGFVRARVDGEVVDASDPPALGRGKPHDVEAVVDRIVVKQGIRPRLQESVELALAHGRGACVVSFREDETWHDRLYSERFACAGCGTSFPDLEPRTFSFNSPYGACPGCEGLGHVAEQQVCPQCGGGRLNPFARAVTFGGLPLHELTALPVGGTIEAIGRMSEDLRADRRPLKKGDWLAEIGMNCGKTRDASVPVPLFQHAGSDGLAPTPEGRLAAERTLPEIVSRLGFLEKVGLDYLSLDRPTRTLSGGELQRARLAAGLGSGLAGVCYILDEPTVGLHARDNDRLIRALEELRDQGASLIVVEHDEEMMRRADYLIDVGPGAGVDGGEIVAAGTPEEVARDADSATARFLREGTERQSPAAPRTIDLDHALTVYGARLHNLQQVDVTVPLGALVCATGVSGSGKSSLFVETLAPAVRQALAGSPVAGAFDRLEGVERISRLVEIDQKPIGRTGRSNAATYTGIWNEIRKLLARTRDARLRGYKARRFSFNARDGRCERCRGWGSERLEMQFLPDLFVTCPLCKGDRFNRQTLSVRYAGMNAADVLRLRIADAVERFSNVPRLRSLLQTLCDVGLGYLELGQSSLTLSGGEAQRIKLAAELALPADAPSLILLDEPTTGLHPAEIGRLIVLLRRLVDAGNSVLVIEHQLDVITAADWIIDLGPEGGAGGGRVVAAGTPAQVAAADSHTATALRRHFERRSS